MGHGKTTYARRNKDIIDVDDLFKPHKNVLNPLKNARQWKQLLNEQRTIIARWSQMNYGK